MGLPGGDVSQATFMADLAKAGFQLPGLPPGPPPKPSIPPVSSVPEKLGQPPGPPPKPKAPRAQPHSSGAASTEGHASREMVTSELPPGARPPPPPPKKPVMEKPMASRASTVFTPTTLRTKKVSQVAGSVLQATSASLSMDKRKNLIASEAPRVSEPATMDDAFQDFMREVG